MGIYRHLWNRSLDGSNRDRRSFVRTVVVATMAAVLFMCVKKDNVFTWLRAERTIALQEKEICRRAAIIESTRNHLEAIRTDRDSLEKFARENFGFAKDGDDIYLTE